MNFHFAPAIVRNLVLKPAHEYNIAEKIQLANSRLFAPSNQTNHLAMNDDDRNLSSNAGDTDKSDTNEEFLYANQQRMTRVTFSSDIEEYDDAADLCDDDDAQSKDDEEIDDEVAAITKSDSNNSTTFASDKMDGLMKFMTINDNTYPDDGSGSDDENPYLNQLKISEVIDDATDEDDRLDAAATQQSIDQLESNALTHTHNIQTEIMLPCRPCSKPNRTVRQSRPCRPTSSKPNGTMSATEQHKNGIHPSRNRSASALPSSSATNRHVSNDLFKIHLNVRACCENKYLDNNRLPRYNGYISQYGLSKDQMEQRKLNRQKYMEQRTRRNRDILKAKEEIAHLNEQAFRQWLIRKNHTSRSKYKNMYDFAIK